MPTEFLAFPKIPRLSRQAIITEKLDGTNASVWVEPFQGEAKYGGLVVEALGAQYVLNAGSRTRFITPDNDNYGFAKWAYANAQELVEGLGPGAHFGEWWGQGIQRRYGLSEKRFSLFNVSRWGSIRDLSKYPEPPPSCCHVVPVLYNGNFSTEAVEEALDRLRTLGSLAVPGWRAPEGVVVYHVASGQCFKKTLDGDGAKGGGGQ